VILCTFSHPTVLCNRVYVCERTNISMHQCDTQISSHYHISHHHHHISDVHFKTASRSTDAAAHQNSMEPPATSPLLAPGHRSALNVTPIVSLPSPPMSLLQAWPVYFHGPGNLIAQGAKWNFTIAEPPVPFPVSSPTLALSSSTTASRPRFIPLYNPS
jgi:hypothetical protein